VTLRQNTICLEASFLVMLGIFLEVLNSCSRDTVVCFSNYLKKKLLVCFFFVGWVWPRKRFHS